MDLFPFFQTIIITKNLEGLRTYHLIDQVFLHKNGHRVLFLKFPILFWKDIELAWWWNFAEKEMQPISFELPFQIWLQFLDGKMNVKLKISNKLVLLTKKIMLDNDFYHKNWFLASDNTC